MNRRFLPASLLSLPLPVLLGAAVACVVPAMRGQTPAPLSAASSSSPPPLSTPAAPGAGAARPAAGGAVGTGGSGGGSNSVATAATPALSSSTGTGSTGTEPMSTGHAGTGPRGSWSEVRVNGPFIAITFDDGPHPSLTPQLLDMLKQRNVKATFFVLGSLVKDHPEIMRRAVAEGHEIGNHSWDHPNLGKMGDDAVRSQLTRTKDAVNAATGGKATDLMRPPYGSITSAQRRWFHDDLGYKIILWSVDPLDWRKPGAEAITRRITESTRSGGIVLAHDIHPGTIAAMPATLDGLLAKGFKFVTVTQLLAMELPPEPKRSPAAAPGAGDAAAGGQPQPPAVPRRTPAPGVPSKITGTEPGTEPPVVTPPPAAATPSPSPTPRRRRQQQQQ